MQNKPVLIVLVLAIVVGGYLYYQHQQNTTTIGLPGGSNIEITHPSK